MKTRHFYALFCACLLIVSESYGAAGDVDLSFDPGSKLDGMAWATAQQPDGKLVIAGDFSTVAGAMRNRIARLNTNGVVDPSFDPGIGPDNHIAAVALQPDGKVLIAGWFTNIDGNASPSIARLNANGSLDSGFNTGTGVNGYLLTVALQSDGKILVGGHFSAINGLARSNLARLNPDGSVDTSFTAEANDYVYSIVVQPDSKIIVGGTFSSIAGTNMTAIARLNMDGTVDSSFNAVSGVGSWGVNVAALQADGRILIGGYFQTLNGVQHPAIARLNADGTVDSGFNASANNLVTSIAMQADGKIIIGGQFQYVDGVYQLYLARLNADGTRDTAYNLPLYITSPGVSSLLVDTNGELFVSGAFDSYLARLNTDSSVDTSFNPSTGVSGSYVFMSVPQPDGNILVAGNFSSVNGQIRQGIARLQTNGQLDTTFDPGPMLNAPVFTRSNPVVYSAALQTDGKVVIGGAFTNINGFDRSNIARLNADGSVDTTFNPGTGTDYYVYNVAIQPDGKILITGGFATVEGVAKTNFARLNWDGSLDTTFNPAPGVGPSILMQSDGRIIAPGTFDTNGVTLYSVVRLNADGSLDPTFAGPSCNCGPLSFEGYSPAGIQADDKIIIVNTTGGIGGPFQSTITRLNADGTPDSGFNMGQVDGYIGGSVLGRSVVQQADGKLLVWGGFTHFNGVPEPGLARLQINGDIDTTYNVGTGPNQLIDWVSVQPDGKSLITGGFTSVNGIARGLIARLDGGTVIPGQAPVITTQPTSQLGFIGSNVIFSVVASGIPTPTYQWFHNNLPLSDDARVSGSTTATLQIDQLQGADAGNYSVIVSNSAGYVFSQPAVLYMPPTISFSPAVTNECQLPGTVMDAVTNNSGDQLTGVWTVNGVPRQTTTWSSPQTSEFYFVIGSPGDSNVVTLTVTNTFGQTASATTIVTTVSTPPYIESATANPPAIWPANGRWVNVTLQAVVGMFCTTNSTWKVTGVTTSSQTTPGHSWRITGNHTVSLRAQQGLRGQPLVYNIMLQATDQFGTVSQPFVVSVPVGRSSSTGR